MEHVAAVAAVVSQEQQQQQQQRQCGDWPFAFTPSPGCQSLPFPFVEEKRRRRRKRKKEGSPRTKKKDNSQERRMKSVLCYYYLLEAGGRGEMETWHACGQWVAWLEREVFIGSVVAVCCVLYCVGIIHPIASDMRTATMDRKLM